MQRYLIKDISLVNEGKIYPTDVLIGNGRLERIDRKINYSGAVQEIGGEGKFLIPGVIDDQVHFREPGLTQKATIYTESKAALAGGITSFMEMPNTRPPALTQELLEVKYRIASQHSLANYSFYMGASNENTEEIKKTNEKKQEVCGLKVFMGSSTGNMLVDNVLTLDEIFSSSELLIAVHCEDERIIRSNLERIKQENGGSLTVRDHPRIRDAEACYSSSLMAIQLAKKHDSRLHILHISTEKELSLFSGLLPLKDKRITAEVCVHHLYFTSDDYALYGNLIKCNPAIKAPLNREALWKALLDGSLDVIATDHAPHTWEEKQQPYPEAPAGIPLVQYALPMMLEHYRHQRISLEKIVEKMCHAPADCFRLMERGYLREGYWADCVILDLGAGMTVHPEDILYKCGWSPFTGHHFPATMTHTFVNGHLVYGNGVWDESLRGKRLSFAG